MNWQIKTAILIFVWTITANFMNPIITLFGGTSSEDGFFWKANFKLWNTPEAIANNVYGIVTLVAGIATIIFLIIGMFNLKNKK